MSNGDGTETLYLADTICAIAAPPWRSSFAEGSVSG